MVICIIALYSCLAFWNHQASGHYSARGLLQQHQSTENIYIAIYQLCHQYPVIINARQQCGHSESYIIYYYLCLGYGLSVLKPALMVAYIYIFCIIIIILYAISNII
jgi:hypothetical protein